MPQKKGNAAKWLMSQKRAMLKKGWHCKKRAKLQNGNFEKRVMPLLVDNHSVAEQL